MVFYVKVNLKYGLLLINFLQCSVIWHVVDSTLDEGTFGSLCQHHNHHSDIKCIAVQRRRARFVSIVELLR